MKKVFLLILVSIVLLLAFTSCDSLPDSLVDKLPDSIAGMLGGSDTGDEPEAECQHQWAEATCMAPKTCTLCGEREGTLLSHNLVDATCTVAKTCTLCNQTWGEPLGHRWSAASCTVARACKTCGAVESEASGHTFADATCEKPKTCTLCSATEGEALGHNYVAVVTDPTCTALGKTTYTCSTCNDSYVDDIKLALGHLDDIQLPGMDATCTEDGLTAGVKCSRCNTDTTPQQGIEAFGHKATSTVVDPTCTDPGYIEYVCTVCGHTYTDNEVPALGHDYGDAACGTIASCQRPGCSDASAAKPIEHDFAPATCTAPATCKRGCGATEGEALGHTMSEASCLAPATCINGCGLTEGEKDTHVVSFSYVDDKPTYTCELCSSVFKLDTYYYVNGEDYTNLTPGNNADHGYTVVENSHNPLIKEDADGNKYYELIKKDTTEKAGQLQFWIPKEDKSKSEFSASNGATGAISFRLNAFLDTNFSMRIVDGGASTDRWSADWSIVENFFSMTPPTLDEESGKVIVDVIGWNSAVLKQIEVGADNFTGWLDIIIGIELDANSDSIVMHYYINGEYCSSQAKELTIATDAVNCFYISGNSTAGGSGIMFDDVVFGYTIAGAWCFDGHIHEWTAGETVSPDCIHDGYTVYTCSQGCIKRDDFVSSFGHVTEDIPEVKATCTEGGYTAGKLCTVCNNVVDGKDVVPALGHTNTDEITAPTCTDEGYTTYTCTVCGFVSVGDEVKALGHDFGNAKCTDVAICQREGCGFNSGSEPIGHDYAPATCTAPATCKREDCGATTGDPIPHDMLPSNCVSPSKCSYGCGHTEGDIGTHVLTHSYSHSTLEFVCSACKEFFVTDDSIYMNGKNNDNMSGTGNSGNFNVATGTQNPVIVDGHYELLNKTGKSGQMQLWIPSSTTHNKLSGFSNENNAVGLLSFKLNAYLNDANGLQLRLADKSQSTYVPRQHSLIALKMVMTTDANGVTTTTITGYDDVVLATITNEDKFTGWMDIAIGIELNSVTNQITLHYYINGKIITTFSVEMPIVTGKINAFYLSGKTSALGSGIMLDDIAFGYKANGEWKFDDCEHNYEAKVTDPTCTDKGYSELYCPDCGHRDVSDFVDALGHIGGEATCLDPANCERCGEAYGEPLGHTGGTTTCQQLAVCERCGEEYGELEHVLSEATCQAASVCSVCNETIGDKASHKIVHRYAFNQVTYECQFCGVKFSFGTNGTGYFIDGTDFNNFTPGLVSDYITEGGRPVIKEDKATGNKYYELINDKGTANGAGKAEVWVPHGSEHKLEGFTMENNAVGMLSFKVDAYMDGSTQAPLAIKLVDNSVRSMSGKSVWTDGCTSEIFMIKAPIDGGDGTYSISIVGLGGETLTTIISDSKWTGWLDVKIGIILDSATNKIILHYYINNVYCGALSEDFAICTKRIDSAYFYGWSSEIGSGYRLDDIGFGYAANGTWNFIEPEVQ